MRTSWLARRESGSTSLSVGRGRCDTGWRGFFSFALRLNIQITVKPTIQSNSAALTALSWSAACLRVRS
jgi:hypothetical protein